MEPMPLHKKLLDVLAPRSCVFCGVCCNANTGNICVPCRQDLPYREPVCMAPPPNIDRLLAVLDYAFPVNAAIKAFKFHRRSYYALAFSELLLSVRESLPSDVDAVMPVPLHWLRRARRGYNQSEAVARPAARQLGLPVIRNVVRTRSTRFQSGLDALQRSRNLRGAFRVRAPILYDHVLVVDDVVTTGTTLQSLAGVLRRSGVKRVSAVCLAAAR